MTYTDPISAFLLAFPALFSIVNPIAGAFIFREATLDRSLAEQRNLALRVSFYSFLVMSVSLWAGSYILGFFGISLAALRIAGGLLLALWAWDLLMTPERREARKEEQARSAEEREGIAFYPLTLPFTTGPGTIAVCIALGASRPAPGNGLVPFFLGVTAAALVLSLTIWLAYGRADRISAALGKTGSRTVTRLSAFLLLCLGVQIVLTGATEALRAAIVR